MLSMPEAPAVVTAAEHLALRDEFSALAAEHTDLAAAHATLFMAHATLAAEHAAMARDMETFRERVLAASEPELVRLAFAVAERVVGRELLIDPTLVTAWAHEGIDAIEGRDGVVVTVAPDVAASVPAGAWTQTIGSGHVLTIDPALAPGTVAVRAGASAVNIGAAARLAAVSDDLNSDGP